jgi:hypothetical protein
VPPGLSWTLVAEGKHLSASRLHTLFKALGGKAVRIDTASANPRGDADERAVSQRTIEADRRSTSGLGSIGYRLSNAIKSAGSRHLCSRTDYLDDPQRALRRCQRVASLR